MEKQKNTLKTRELLCGNVLVVEMDHLDANYNQWLLLLTTVESKN